MNPSRYAGVRLLMIALTFLCCVASSTAQEGFKGAVFKRTVKKANHPSRLPARGSAKAADANNKGNAHFDGGLYEEAVADYQQATRLNPGYAEAYANLGDAYQELKRYEEAIKAYKQAIKLRPNLTEAYDGLGDVYLALGREAESSEAYSHTDENYSSGGVLNRKAATLVKPAFPPLARAAHVSGSVSVQVLIDETGQVIRARAISGNPLLQAAAVKAASESVFSPTRLSGQSVRVSGIIVYNFALQ